MLDDVGYTFKTQPYAHQLKAFRETRAEKLLAVLWEMGTGKSKLILDQAAWNYQQGTIDGLLIVAPAGVHTNWINLEVPKHLPEAIPHMCVTWLSGKMNTQAARRTLTSLYAFEGLSILAMNIDAVITGVGIASAIKFMQTRRTLLVVDESQIIKTPSAKRTKTMIRIGRYAKMRRIATGTPITQSPLDLFTQFNFLEPGLLGHTSYWSFKHEFANWRLARAAGGHRSFEELVGYKNLDKLMARCAPYATRATKEECLDLPPKIYEEYHFHLTRDQQHAYEQLKARSIMELESMERVTVTHVLTRLLRLQQISSGYWPAVKEPRPCDQCYGDGSTNLGEACPHCDGTGVLIDTHPAHELVAPKENPRLQALRDLLETSGPTIIWCRFRYDVDLVMRHVPGAVRYDGETSPEDRVQAIERFQNGQSDVFVGTPQAGGRGLTLTRAKTVVYYSHSFSYETRIQSEDRAHRLGLNHSVTYVDLVALGTVDHHLIETVKSKKELATLFDQTDPAFFLKHETLR